MSDHSRHEGHEEQSGGHQESEHQSSHEGHGPQSVWKTYLFPLLMVALVLLSVVQYFQLSAIASPSEPQQGSVFIPVKNPGQSANQQANSQQSLGQQQTPQMVGGC